MAVSGVANLRLCLKPQQKSGSCRRMGHFGCTCWFVSEVQCAFQMYLRGYLMCNICKLCTCCSHRVLRRVPRRSHVHTHVCAVRHACLCAGSTHVSPSPHVLPPVGSLGLHVHARVGAIRRSCIDSKSTRPSPSPYALRPAVLLACARTRLSHSPYVSSCRAQTSEPIAVCAAPRLLACMPMGMQRTASPHNITGHGDNTREASRPCHVSAARLTDAETNTTARSPKPCGGPSRRCRRHAV